MTSERQLSVMLATLLAGQAPPVPYAWGWLPLGDAENPPALPAVVMLRTLADAGAWADMCSPTSLIANTEIQIHVWALNYEQARDLQAIVRAAVNAENGWALQTETDTYEGQVRAWQIVSTWRADGLTME